LARVTAAIEGRVLEALERRAEAANATVSAAAMAAFALAAARTAGVAELRIQCPMTVRDDDFEQRVAGYFLNSCTLRLQVSPDQPVEQLLDAVSCRLAEALAHKDLPYAQILDAHPALSEPGFHHARFAFVSSADAPMALEGCEISELPSARRAAKFDLQVTAERRPARLAFHIEFDPAVYAHEEIAAFAAIISAAAHDLAFGRTEAAGLEPTDASPGDVREALRRSLSARLPENARQARNAPNAQALPPPIRPTPELAGAGLVVAGAEGTDLSEYLAGRRDWATSALLRLGAVLFRGFDELSVESFADLLDKISLGTLDYENRSTPRTRLLNNIFTSTEYPANESIPLHNENAYSAHWPDLLAFLCRRPAQSGGATPICDSREVYRRISPPTREKFEALGVTYTRRFGCVGLSWQETFQTDRREAVDAYCAANNIERAWNSDGDLDTRQTLPAVRTHPVTGEKVWFNQAHLFHVTSLGPATAAAMIELYGVDQLPRHALFGDGSAIPDEMLDEIRAAYAAAEVPVQWRVGDLLLLDNMLFAHGRQPYRGEREIVVGMARLYG
jgi:alpha-ketoglutarate-dependent taurine dioxygenase